MRRDNLKFKYSLTGICMFLSVLAVYAQEPNISFGLTQDETGTTKQYLASDRISLKPGFVYNATNGKTFNAKIEKTLPLPVNSSTYINSSGYVTTNPTEGAIVGTVPGSASVTPTGAASYQIPIEVPTGINGLQPQVAVAYNSQGGFGNLGIGWDISCTSSITRGGENLYFDGKNSTISFTNKDQLYLDGQRLIKLSGTHFEAGAIYATQVENHTRIEIMNGANGIYFKATSPDGKIVEFGNSSNSLLKKGSSSSVRVLAWKVSKVSDIDSNYMTYTYINSGQYISRIDYTGNGTTQNPQRSVIFNYDFLLSVPNTISIGSFKIEQFKLLTSICTYIGTTKIKDYRFSYTSQYSNTLNNGGIDSHLINMTVYAKDGSKYNFTRINWGNIPLIEETIVSTVTTGFTNLPDTVGSLYFADLNGDGYEDRIEMHSGKSVKDQRGTVTSTTDGSFRAFLYNPIAKGFEISQFIQSFKHADIERYKPRIVTCDYNNDLKQDIVLINEGKIELYSLYNPNCIDDFQKIGSTIDIGVDFLKFASTFQQTQQGRDYQVIPTDVNGDGFVDLVFTFAAKRDRSSRGVFIPGTDPGYKVFYGSATGFLTNPSQSFYNGDRFIRFANGDFNGDSKLDFMGLSNSPNSYYQSNPVNFSISAVWGNKIDEKDLIIPLDCNSDGLTDLLVQNSDHKWKILKNNGGIEIEPTEINDLGIHDAYNQHEDERYNIYPLDYTGDGYIDLILGDESFSAGEFVKTTWYFYKNKGDRFYLNKTITSNDRIDEISGTVSDINHDGVADLVLPAGDYFKAFTLPNASHRRLVSSITNGLGNSVSFGYANNENIDTESNIEGVKNLNSPMLVAKSLTNADGSITTYNFEKAKVHTAGKGIIGYTQVTEKNETANRLSVSEYEIDPSYYYLSLKNNTTKDYSGTHTFSTSTQTSEVKVVDTTLKRYIPTVSSQTNVDVLKNITQSSSAVYDDLGNVTTQTSSVGDGNDKMTNIVETVYKVRAGGTIKYLPETVTSTQKKSGESDVVRTVEYVYNDNGKLIKETKDPTDLNKIVTEYKDFDPWGHACTVEVSITGKPVRKSTMVYTPSGLYVESKTNNLLEKTSYVWDETLGLLKSETDHWGRKTTYTYDAWNKPLLVTYPEGYRKGSALQWAVGAVAGAVYYSYEETKGSSPVWTWYNALGQEVRKDYYGLNEKKICVSTEYNEKKQVYRVSDPYFENEAAYKTWVATYTYDEYGRPSTVTTKSDVSTMAYNTRTESVSRTAIGESTPFFTSSKELNSAGLLKTSTENGKAVSFAYFPTGLTKTSTPEGGQALIMDYNLQGKRKYLKDPDAGEVFSIYNGFGELTEEKQKVHNSQYIVTTNNYNDNGTLNTIVRNGETTTYTYGDTNHKSRPTSISIGNKNVQNFEYDYYGRVKSVYEKIDEKGFYSSNIYDLYGNVSSKQYPSGYSVYNTYDKYGNLTEVKDGSNRPIWKAVTENARGQITQEQKGNNYIYYGFDERGLPTFIADHNEISMSYRFDNKHNLKFREDHMTGSNESYVYDTHDRLTNWNANGDWSINHKDNSIVYNPTTGNIDSKTDIGTFKYGVINNEPGAVNPNPGPHALTSVEGALASIQSQQLNVTYTDFKKINTLSEDNKYYELTYGVDDQRRKSEYKVNGQTQLTRYYLGDYEEEIDALGNVKQIHYLSGAIMITTNYNQKLYYTYADYQGSLIALIDESGEVERYAYDPWGARRNPNNWTESDSRTSWIVNRGYTGHEHLDAFGIINMNGRVYDPLTAMFFSPDPYVQAPGNWVNYNRYGYCLNNPMKYTDPSGEFWHLVIGAAIGGIINWAAHGAQFSWKGLGYFGVGAAAGALGAGVAGGISSTLAVAGKTAGGFAAGFWGTSAATTATSSFIAGAAIGAGGGATGGFINGFGNALVDGKNFGNALGKGALGGLMGGLTGGLIGGLVGGIDAAIDGRRFSDGATVKNASFAEVDVDKVLQEGTNNCLPASGSCIDKSLGGSTTQQNLRTAAGGSAENDPLRVGSFWEKTFATQTNRRVAAGDLTDVVPTLKAGGRVAANLHPVDGVGHGVVIQKIYLQTVTKINQYPTSTVMYRIMDPAKGSFRDISYKELDSFIYRIFK